MFGQRTISWLGWLSIKKSFHIHYVNVIIFISSQIDGHDSGTESDGDLDQEDDLIQEHDMELSKSRHHLLTSVRCCNFDPSPRV